MKAFLLLMSALCLLILGCSKEPDATRNLASNEPNDRSESLNKNAILISLSESLQTKFGKEDFNVQSSPQKVFSAVWAAESEINNGGFIQYFQNTSCETSLFVVEAFHAIDAPRTAAICERAIKIAFPNGLPVNSQDISTAVANFPKETMERLEKLDAEFLNYPHDLTDLLFTFVSKHPKEFGALAEVKEEIE